MSEDGPPDREGALDAALAAHGDYRTDGFQALDDARKSPLDALLAKEDYKGDEALLDWIDDATVDAIAHRFEAEVHGARLEAFRRLIEFLFDGGRVKTPRDACIRLYSVAKGITPDLLPKDYSLEELGQLFGEGPDKRATWSARIKRTVNQPMEKSSGRVVHLKFQKAPETVKKYSEAQQGNTNRKGKGKRRRRTR